MVTTACEGQTIVGKWKFISTTMYFTPEGAASISEKFYPFFAFSFNKSSNFFSLTAQN